MAWKVLEIEENPTITLAFQIQRWIKKVNQRVAPSLSMSHQPRVGNLIPNANPLHPLKREATFPIVPKKPGRRKMGVESDSKGLKS